MLKGGSLVRTNLKSLALALSLVGAACGVPTYAATVAGHIDLIAGEVRIEDVQGRSRTPKVNDMVQEGDTIVTARDGELHVHMEDEAYMAVRPNTRLKIANYVAQGGADDHAIVSLIFGTFRSVTGWIGKHYAKNYQIQTPTMTIGIRGTDHEPLVIPEPQPGQKPIGEPGTYDKVNSGSTFIEAPNGRVNVEAGQTGFAPKDAKKKPQLMSKVPDFYQPTKNEKLIEQRTHELREHLDKKMDERRKSHQETSEEHRAAKTHHVRRHRHH